MTEAEIMAALHEAVADECGQRVALTRDTSALDVQGWDSLAHVRIIMNLEARLGTEIDVDKSYRVANIGELIDLVRGNSETTC